MFSNGKVFFYLRPPLIDGILCKIQVIVKGISVTRLRVTKRSIVCVCLFFLFFSVISQESGRIKVGFTNSSAFLFENEGTYYGYAYEYLIEIAKYTGWHYEFVKGTRNECLDRLASGEIDIFPGIKRTESIADDVLVPSRSIGSWPLMLYSHSESTSFSQFNDFSQMDNLVIGIARGCEGTEILMNKSKEAGTTPLLKEYPNPSTLKLALVKKEVDLIFYSSIHFDPEVRCIASFAPEDYYIGVTRKNPTLAKKLQSAIEEIQSKNPYYNSDLHRKYYSGIHSSVHELTTTEKEFIRNSSHIKVSISSVYPPIDAADSIHGSSILMSILDLISIKTGLRFTYIISTNNAASTMNLTEGKAQVMAAVFNDFSWAEANNIYVTLPVLPIHLYEIHNKNRKPEEAPESYALTKDYFDSGVVAQTGNILVLPNLYECLKAVEKGKIDKTYTNLYALLYYSQQNGFTNLSYDGSNAVMRELCLGVAKNADRRILSIINKGISLITEEELQQVIYNNTILYSKKISLRNYIRNSTLEFTLFIILTLCILTAIIFLIILNHLRRQKNLALEKANHAKTEFLSRMSHEIRTPLTAIVGLTEMAQTKKSDEKKIGEYLDKIDISSKHLLQLINDVLDMSKINEGTLYLKKALFSLSTLLKTLYVVYQPVAEQNKIILTIQKPSTIPDSYFGDSLRIKEVLINLISNAIKYNKKEGVVTLAIEQIPTTDKKENVTLRFTVSDTGIGIHKKVLDTLFEPFERDEIADIRQITGSGLGLAICKKMLELMDSTINVSSVPGIGSSFWFDLKLTACDEDTFLNEKYGEKSLCSLEGRRLLIAEDNDMNAEIIEQLIRSLQPSDYVRVMNGKECVSVFEKSPEHYYDTIIMDIRMPIMDGYKATQHIRALNRADAKKVYIIALSANAYVEDIEMSLEAGMNAHCSKPIDKQELQIALMGGA